MFEFSRPLGDAVKKARTQLELTQSEVAEALDIDSRTILNIENYKGNPKMEILYPLIRTLKIDPCEIFQPEEHRSSPGMAQLRMLVADCSEQEALALIPVLNSVLSVLRSQNAISIK